ncbi:MAG: hypothetical protein R3C11_26055 [Planctomycetaceae bacterium]
MSSIRWRSTPDLFLLGLPEGKSEIPIELFIGPRENRGTGLCHDISLRPMSACRKIAIINDAHLLNEASGNALLKTLEEPPEKSILILIAEQEQRILQTIRSRCQLVRFDPLPESDVVELMLAAGLVEDREKAVEIARYSEGAWKQLGNFAARLALFKTAGLQHTWPVRFQLGSGFFQNGGDGRINRFRQSHPATCNPLGDSVYPGVLLGIDDRNG